MRRLAPLCLLLLAAPARAESLPETKPLTEEGDLAARMVEGIDRYLTREGAASAEKRQAYWKMDFSSPEAYTKSVRPNRERLRKVLGVVDERVPFADLEYVAGPKTPAPVAETDDYRAFAVRWPVLAGVDAEGLLLEPKGKVTACVVAVPDAGLTPEMLVGLADGAPREEMRRFTAGLAAHGCRVLVPTLIDRRDDYSGNPALGRMTNQPHREFLYRMAYEMGRHVIGYEVQKVLAGVDWFCLDKDHPPVGVYGYGEGALIAYYSAALDDRIKTTAVSGFLGGREVWREPIYRNVWGLWREFGDAEVGRLIAPRALRLNVAEGPEVSGPPPAHDGRAGAAPGALPKNGPLDAQEYGRLADWASRLPFPMPVSKSSDAQGRGAYKAFRADLGLAGGKDAPPRPADRRKDFDPAVRQRRQFAQLVGFTQQLMRDSARVREERFWSKLDTSSLEKFESSCGPLRGQFAENVIGPLPAPTEKPNPRSRLLYDEPRWKGYEVALDIYPDVFAYGILLLPKDLKPGERRPVVVCQHGRQGRPADVCDPKERTKIYHSFGARLADLGYVVYAPQSPTIFEENFRVLQRKANPLGLTLYSFIARQQAVTLDWLTTLPNVDPGRIAFYGLSYGGKTAMRVPAVEARYCLSICSGDFNDCVAKNASVDYSCSFMFTSEYEMPEWDLGPTFNYAEMAALIAPRPFMVERGHDDGVAVDEYVASEYAKVRRLYSRLKVPERTAVEFFDGVHEIHGEGTFRFLKDRLGWPP